jgi:ATP synthase protein I
LNATSELTERARRVIGMQILASLVLAIGFYAGVSPVHGRSAFFGGLISVLLSYLLSRGVKRAEAIAATNPRQSMTILYIGAAQRFFIAIAAFAVGLAYLKLEPLAMFIGFAVAQLSYVLNAREPARKKKEA